MARYKIEMVFRENGTQVQDVCDSYEADERLLFYTEGPKTTIIPLDVLALVEVTRFGSEDEDA
jgi:hypothetical protein